MKKVENKVKKQFKDKTEFNAMNYFQFVEVNDKSVCMHEHKIPFEKLNGRYHLNIKQELNMPLKIN